MSDDTANRPEPPLIETVSPTPNGAAAPPPTKEEVREALAVLERHYQDELNGLRRIRRKITKEREEVTAAYAAIKDLHKQSEGAEAALSKAAARGEEHSNRARESADSAAAAKADAVAALQVVKSSKSDAEANAAVILAVAEQAETAEAHAGEIEAAHKIVSESKTRVETLKKSVEEVADKAEQASSRIETANEEIAASHTEIKRLETEANKSAATTKSLVEKLAAAEQDVESYKESLMTLEHNFEVIAARIEGLLPGATSVGLAQAFETRGAKFVWARVVWNGLFVLSLAGLAAIGWGFKTAVTEEAIDWPHALLMTVLRLPIALPLVWLALHSAKRAVGIRRVEEDYAYKAVMSRSFEGYKREMQNIGEAPPDSPIRKLCADTLHMLSLLPGRLHDVKHQEATPASELVNGTRQLRRGLKGKISTPVGSAEIEDSSTAKDDE